MDVDGSSKVGSKEVQPILGFGSGSIRIKKQNSCNQPQHWDKALLIVVVVVMNGRRFAMV